MIIQWIASAVYFSGSLSATIEEFGDFEEVNKASKHPTITGPRC